ncbi:MAG: hypothetical protein GXP01_06030, partial [Alphaproteobacteria bacterium]|nr:hypothetical protein [Alphaproteobacteria bacterium]
MGPRSDDQEIALFGTADPPAVLAEFNLGRLDFLRTGSAIRRICWDGIEVVRGLDCLVRDAGWGTYEPQNVREELDVNLEAGSFRLRRRFGVGDGALNVDLTITATREGVLVAGFEATATRDVEVSRAGFTLLHPLAGVAGMPLTVTHADGGQEQGRFPLAVVPAQPVFDIAGLSHTVDGVRVEIGFDGEIFEMEDQRNWSDASFKTYCRPLALPFPYTIAAGARVHQRIRVALSGSRRPVGEQAAKKPTRVPGAQSGPVRAVMPDVLLCVEPGWLSDAAAGLLAQNTVAGLLVRMGGGYGWPGAELGRVAQLIAGTKAYVDVEIVVPENADPARFLGETAGQLAGYGLSPRHVIAVPEPYLKSYQPAGPWPAGPTPGELVDPSRHEFPGAKIGAGMLTNFAEFNRCPPSATAGDYVTHGSSAIVHAADDLSVFETLQALPDIFRTVTQQAAGRPYRLGLVSIGMRSNPYGAFGADNAGGSRRPMVRHDPRQRGLFNAAFVISATWAAAKSGCQAIALAAPAGPFAIADTENSGALYPVYHAINALGALSGTTATEIGNPPGAGTAFRADNHRIYANCSLSPAIAEPGQNSGVSILDTGSFAAAGRDPD